MKKIHIVHILYNYSNYNKMASKSKSSKKSTVHYYGCVYGGCMKQGWVQIFETKEDPEEYFTQFKDSYGSKVHGAYAKTTDEEEYFEKIQEKLADNHNHGKLYEVNIDTAKKTLKEVTGAKKVSLLGGDDHDEEKAAQSEAEEPVKETAKEDKKVKVKSEAKAETKPASKTSSKKAKEVESEDESEDEQPSEAESEEEVKETKKAAPSKKPAKQEAKEQSKAKETKAKSSK